MITAKDYREGRIHTVAIENSRGYGDWILDKCPSLLQYAKCFQDNREAFKILFGKPDWHYRGSEFYFHVWVREHNGETFLLMTAKGKGTCIEIVGSNIENKSDAIISFVENLLEQLNDFEKKIGSLTTAD